MKNTSTVSHHKIIFFVLFVCAALITSLFIFYSSQKPKSPVLSSDQGLIFPVARDIKSFELISANDKQKFSQKNFYNHWTLLFFGFTHCSSVCPTTLEMISRAYPKLHEQFPNLQVALISLDPERDSFENLAKYTHNYHPEFIGVTGKIQELRKLQSQLGVFSSRDQSAPALNYQIQHTSSILLVNPEGKWAGLFKYGLSPENFAKSFVSSVNYLSSHT